MNSVAYRREIDGLRAIAVIPVVLFHAGLDTFSGGFVGVDVFFVISGYLITSILIAELSRGDFTVVGFYERRARRILPALFVVLAACLPLAWFWMVPNQLADFGASLLAVSTFVSNVLFWQEEGYFARAAEMKPLLHTWSLAVEEQYYLFFPIALAFVWRFGKRNIFWILIASTAASLALCELGSHMFREANFYLAPTRAWELFAGSICGVLGKRGGCNKLGAAGLALVVVPIFAYSARTPFPSVYAVVPVLGTALIILYATASTWVGRLLGTPVLVGLGLISYSTYLWHQPLFAFARLYSISQPSKTMMVCLGLFALCLAFISWRFVEAPFRNRSQISRRQVFWGSASGIVIFSLIGGGLVLQEGAPSRFDERAQRLLALSDHSETMKVYGLRGCFIDDDQGVEALRNNGCYGDSDLPRVVVFGDSEAAHLMVGVRASYLGKRIDQWTGTSCRPFEYSNQGARCKAVYHDFVDRLLPQLEADDILIVEANWIRSYDVLKERQFRSALAASFAKLRSGAARIIVIGNTPEFMRSPNDIMALKSMAESTVYMASEDFRFSDTILTEEAKRVGFEVVLPSEVMCKAGLLECLVARDGKPLFFDAGHLSPEGSHMVARYLLSKTGSK